MRNSWPVRGGEIWLRVSRAGTTYALHASEDGEWWDLVRYLGLGGGPAQVGFVAQSPTGQGCRARFDAVRFAPEGVADIRHRRLTVLECRIIGVCRARATPDIPTPGYGVSRQLPASAARVSTPSFANARDRCTSTVLGLRNSFSAICRFVMPARPARRPPAPAGSAGCRCVPAPSAGRLRGRRAFIRRSSRTASSRNRRAPHSSAMVRQRANPARTVEVPERGRTRCPRTGDTGPPRPGARLGERVRGRQRPARGRRRIRRTERRRPGQLGHRAGRDEPRSAAAGSPARPTATAFSVVPCVAPRRRAAGTSAAGRSVQAGEAGRHPPRGPARRSRPGRRSRA